MNSLLLLLLGAVVLVFGYRFYAKLLAAEVYRLEDNYSIAGAIRADGPEQIEGHPHLVFGHYFASMGVVATLLGTLLAAAFGWIPAFLGLIVGISLVGGVYGMGGLWLSQQTPPSPEMDIPTAAAEALGAPTRRLFLLLVFLVLLGANAVFAVLAAQLLVAYPSAVLPFWLQIPVALGLGLFLYRRPVFEIIPASAIALLLLIMLTWLAGKIPFAVAGALTGRVWNTPVFSVDGGAVWLLLLFLYVFYTTRLPLWKLARPRGWLTSLQTGVLFLITLGGLLFLHPSVVAPEFHRAQDLTSALPWLLVVLGSGTLAGVYVLAAGTLASQQLPPLGLRSRPFGYGGALADAALALSALVVVVAAFDSPTAWRQHYDLALVPVQLLDVYVKGVAQFASPFGIDPEFMHTFTAVILATLATTGLEAGVRLQRTLLQNMQPQTAVHPRAPVLTWIAATLLALAVYAHADGVSSWNWLGLANLIAAGLALTLIAARLRQRGRPPTILAVVLAPALMLLLIGDWALLAQLFDAWAQASYGAFIVGLPLLGGQLWVLAAVARVFRPQRPAGQLDTGA